MISSVLFVLFMIFVLFMLRTQNTFFAYFVYVWEKIQREDSITIHTTFRSSKRNTTNTRSVCFVGFVRFFTLARKIYFHHHI